MGIGVAAAFAAIPVALIIIPTALGIDAIKRSNEEPPEIRAANIRAQMEKTNEEVRARLEMRRQNGLIETPPNMARRPSPRPL